MIPAGPKEGGSTLILAIVFVFVASILIAVVSRGINTNAKVSNAARRMATFEIMKRQIDSLVSCAETETRNSACASGAEIDLYDSLGSISVPATGTFTMGPWSLTGVCIDADKFQINARNSSGSTFRMYHPQSLLCDRTNLLPDLDSPEVITLVNSGPSSWVGGSTNGGTCGQNDLFLQKSQYPLCILSGHGGYIQQSSNSEGGMTSCLVNDREVLSPNLPQWDISAIACNDQANQAISTCTFICFPPR